ncbi:MAG: polysaccharide deacetylase family protein [Pseudomonadota bacterium]
MVQRRLMLKGLASAAAALALPGAAAGQGAPVIKLPGDVSTREAATILAVRTPSPVVALTFDDGPHPTLTPILLDLLAARGMFATFYVVGDWVRRHPGLVARMLHEGHEIGNHSWSHPVLARLSDGGLLRELDDTTRAVYEVTGKVPVTMRPPYGAMTSRQRALVHGSRKLPTILWSVDPQDWRRPGPQIVTRRILGAARPGAIILAHDIHSSTIRAMPATLDGLSARGLRTVTISQLLGWPRWQTRNFRLKGV